MLTERGVSTEPKLYRFRILGALIVSISGLASALSLTTYPAYQIVWMGKGAYLLARMLPGRLWPRWPQTFGLLVSGAGGVFSLASTFRRRLSFVLYGALTGYVGLIVYIIEPPPELILIPEACLVPGVGFYLTLLGLSFMLKSITARRGQFRRTTTGLIAVTSYYVFAITMEKIIDSQSLYVSPIPLPYDIASCVLTGVGIIVLLWVIKRQR